MPTPRRLTFGANADAYERARPAWPEEAARWLVPAGARVVLEVGAGTGKLTQALAGVAERVLAVEPDDRMLTKLRERGLEGMAGSAEAIPAGDGEADAVVSGSSLHWFDLAAALPEVHRVLAPGGRFAFAWNHRDTSRPAVAAMSDALDAVRPPGRGWASRDWPALVAAGGLFRDVGHARFPFVHELPREALDDHLRSYAAVAELPGSTRRELLAQVAEILAADPEIARGEAFALPFLVTAYRATRAEPGASPSP